LVNFFNRIDFGTTVDQTIQLIRSTDQGRTWEKEPTTVARLINGAAGAGGTITPDRQEAVRDAFILFHPAVNPKNGNLYVVWQDVRLDAIQQILLATSTDGGDSWTLSGIMNKTPANPLKLRQQAFNPSVEVGPNGEVVITYYDFRNDDATGELTDHWAIFCNPKHSDCTDPGKYQELRLTDHSFDLLDAPIARGHFLGDYFGLVRAGDAVHGVFGIADSTNMTSLYDRKIIFSNTAITAAVP
jgi:hypothetical protein